MLNYIWLGLVLIAVVLGGITGQMKEVTDGAFKMARDAVMDLALPLTGMFCLWLGVMRLAERSGLIAALAKALRPVLVRIFPEVPAGHPAMGAMLMNMAANMLGLSNAATPLGLRAMQHLQALNPHPGTATNAMCTFLAINTSSVQLLPATAIAVLTVKGGANPTAIVGTALLATACSTAVALLAVKTFERWRIFRVPPVDPSEKAIASDTPDPEPSLAAPAPMPIWGKPAIAVFLAFFVGLAVWQSAFPEHYGETAAEIRVRIVPNAQATPAEARSDALLKNPFARTVGAVSLLAVPFVLAFFPFYAHLRGVKVYEEFVEGAKEGFATAVRIIPFLVAILVAIAMFRSAGGIAMLQGAVAPVLVPLRFPVELLPLVLVRPLSGSATLGMFTTVVDTFGPDHILSMMAGTIFGSTETTFYVIAVYFGSVAIRRTRHAVAAGLLADAAGVVASIAVCRLILG